MNLYFRFPDFKTKALTLSYDDGTVHDRRMVGILNRYGIKCTFNLNSGILGAGGRISREEAAELYRGHEIAVHTLTHPRLDCVSTAEAAREILLDRQNLEEITGGIVDGMAYPYGLYDTNGEPETAALCGIRYARTTLSTHGFGLPKDFLRWNPTCHHADSSFAELAGRFLAPDDTEHFWRISPKLFTYGGTAMSLRTITTGSFWRKSAKNSAAEALCGTPQTKRCADIFPISSGLKAAATVRFFSTRRHRDFMPPRDRRSL